MNKMLDLVTDISESIGAALGRHNISLDEYRAGVGYLMKVSEAKEIGLLCDVFMNWQVVNNADRGARNSKQTIQGPYFLEDAPLVDGKLPTYSKDNGVPLHVSGQIKDVNGKPVGGVGVDIWHSTPDGKYSGFHGLDADFSYRGKVMTDADGKYHVTTTLPVPYRIPDKGPTGALLEMMGRHSWRPAHVHFKLRKEGFKPLVTQAYFEGGDWVDSDSCRGVFPELVFKLGQDGDAKTLVVDFIMDSAS